MKQSRSSPIGAMVIKSPTIRTWKMSQWDKNCGLPPFAFPAYSDILHIYIYIY